LLKTRWKTVVGYQPHFPFLLFDAEPLMKRSKPQFPNEGPEQSNNKIRRVDEAEYDPKECQWQATLSPKKVDEEKNPNESQQ